MSSRITVFVSAKGEFNIYLNEEGREILIKELQHLSEKSDHFHLGPKDFSEVDVSSIPYHADDKVLEYGVVCFRPDSWDRQYFPHVFGK